MSHGRAHRDRITDQAAEWFARAQDPGFSDADKAALADWLAGSAEHVREYLSLAALVGEMGQLPDRRSVEELVALAREGGDDTNVVPMSAGRASEPHGEDWSSGNSSAGGLDQQGSFPSFGPASAVRDEGGSVKCAASRAGAARSELQQGSPAYKDRGLRSGGVRRWMPAAALFLGVGIASLLMQSMGPEVYSTGLGEQRAVRLEDGSVITLNAQSTVELRFSEERRYVSLLSGEVLFDVAKDAERPFQVFAQGTMIRAIGTAFNVRHRGEDTTVTVVEGTVEVESLPTASSPGARVGRLDKVESSAAPVRQVEVRPVRVTVGQQAKIDAKSGQVAVIDTNVAKAMAWRERRLVFDAWPLSKVVAEFNLYNAQPLVIDDPKLPQRAISGAFDADDRESFALFLEQAGIADAETRPDGTIELRQP